MLVAKTATQEEPFGASGVSVPAGTDYMVTVYTDLSQTSLVNYIYSTSSTGAGAANIFLFECDDTNAFRGTLAGSISSNTVQRKLLSSPTDVRTLPKVKIGFRNADSVAVTVYLKICKQF